MKIFILGDKLTGGGAERVAAILANGLAELGHEVLLYCYAEKATYPIGEKVKLMPYNRNRYHLRKRYDILAKIMYMGRQIRTKCPDVVIGFMGENAMVGKAAVFLSGLKVPVVYSDHNALERLACAPMNRRERFYKFHMSKYCAAYTVLTQADKKFVENRLKNVCVMPNPLGIVPASAESLPRKEKILLAVGRIDAWFYKGFDILIEAWKTISGRHFDWKLLIVGSGSSESMFRLRELAGQGNAQIEFIPFTPDILEYYRKAEIFVLSSRYEGFGLVLIEAMSQGCASIACDHKGRQGEIITDGVDGLLCYTENPKMLGEKIESLIVNADLRKRIQKNAIGTVCKFSPSIYALRWNELLKRIVYDWNKQETI